MRLALSCQAAGADRLAFLAGHSQVSHAPWSTVACAKVGNLRIKPSAFSSLSIAYTPSPQTGVFHKVCICAAW